MAPPQSPLLRRWPRLCTQPRDSQWSPGLGFGAIRGGLRAPLCSWRPVQVQATPASSEAPQRGAEADLQLSSHHLKVGLLAATTSPSFASVSLLEEQGEGQHLAPGPGSQHSASSWLLPPDCTLRYQTKGSAVSSGQEQCVQKERT